MLLTMFHGRLRAQRPTGFHVGGVTVKFRDLELSAILTPELTSETEFSRLLRSQRCILGTWAETSHTTVRAPRSGRLLSPYTCS